MNVICRSVMRRRAGEKGRGRNMSIFNRFGLMESCIGKSPTVGLCVFAFLIFATVMSVSAQTAIKADEVWTMTGAMIPNGVVLVKDGKIEAVGTAAEIAIPANYRVVAAKVVTPGLIDAHTVIGLNGYLNQPNDQMALDQSGPIQPEIRAIDAYNPEEVLIGWVRGFGVTTIHTGHQPSALVPGQTMIAKTFGKTVDDATLVPTAMINVTIGDAALAQGKAPGTRGKAIAMLRAELIKAGSYKGEPRDLRQEIWKKVLAGEIRLLVTANRAIDIITALRLAKEFKLKIVLDGAAEAQQVMADIKASGFPVIIHPTMFRATGELSNLSMETASKLKAAGITVALQSGYEGYVPKTRVVLFEAAVAAANGLSKQEALATITIDAAKILGLDSRIGSIAPGKDADLAMFDGDPFEYVTHCTGTMINGAIVSDVVR